MNENTPTNMQDIKDIKGLELAPSIPLWAIITICGVLLFLIVLWWLYRRQKNKKIKMRPLSADENALAALSNLRFSSSAECKAFYFSLSEILKTYIEDRFAFQATEKTTEEIKKEMNSVHPLNEEDKEMLVTILLDFDLVKFADSVRSNDQATNDIQRVKDFIHKTKKREETLP